MSRDDRNGMAILVRDVAAEDVLRWAEMILGAVVREAEAGDAVVYDTSSTSFVLTPRMEGGPFSEIWFRGTNLPWENAATCARSAARGLQREVLFEPDDDDDPYAWISVAPDGTERMMEWIGEEPTIRRRTPT